MPLSPDRRPFPEFWAGVECTVNRVGDHYLDQLEFSGHATRRQDLERFAELGITALRYPILWERTQPNRTEAPDWTWADDRLGLLRALRIEPIVGLVHHGSGPRYTSLVEPGFAEGLADYARAVAIRYPWVECYTPVNEPLTTARFSALYGHWYPHARDGLFFARALLAQCRAVVLAMRAIRTINAAARLIQTEDLGKTFSTPSLTYQADFENERRWLSWDLLCGRVDPRHPLWDFLRWLGVQEPELTWFLDHRCPPDLLGVNYYVTSERFLDERVERYPAATHGGNGRHRYADVEAVRVRETGLAGPRALLAETWQRYRLPIAVTEVQLGCTREEQMRWLLEVWDAASSLRAEGADIRAVTAWALLGAYDWNSLVTRADGHYESGVFDLRAPAPRPTALARMVKDLAVGRRPSHPALDTPGWWHRPERLTYSATAISRTRRPSSARTRPLLVTGAGGTLAGAFARICTGRGLVYRALSRRELDITDPVLVQRWLAELRPWAVINAAGYARVDAAETEPDRCARENTHGAAVLAEACARQGISLLTFSSDLVFDGQRGLPYRESDPTAPLNVLGWTKEAAERRVREVLPEALIVRTSACFGPWDSQNFVTQALRTLAGGGALPVAADVTISPTYIPDLVHACLDLLLDGESGVWHLANRGAITWAALVRRAAELANLRWDGIRAYPLHALGLPAARPRSSALESERGCLLPSLEDALVRYVAECEVGWHARGRDSTPAPLAGIALLGARSASEGPL